MAKTAKILMLKYIYKNVSRYLEEIHLEDGNVCGSTNTGIHFGGAKIHTKMRCYKNFSFGGAALTAYKEQKRSRL